MRLDPFPPRAAWEHRGARAGLEVSLFVDQADQHRLIGHTTAVESGTPWSVGYDIEVDASWRTRSALVTGLGASGSVERRIQRDDAGVWLVDGERREDLAGCDDIDLESSAVTNTLPLHRVDLEIGQGIDVPAVFVRAEDLRVERLEQRYTLIDLEGERIVIHYESSTFAFETDLVYDRSGLVVTYPGLADRCPVVDARDME